MEPPGPLPRDEATAADEPACAPTRADFRTAAPRETRNGSSSPAPPRRAHAARTRGRTPLHPHSHALHTHGVSDPTLGQETAGSRHPARAPPSPPDSTPLLGRRGTRPPRPRAAEAARRPSRRPARSGFLSTARAPHARPRDEAGRKGRRHDWGWHRGSMTGATPLTHAPTHPSSSPPPPPFLQHKRLQKEPPSPCNLPVAHSSAASAVLGVAETETRAREAQGCCVEIRAEAASRASRVPSPLPPRSAPATARRSPRLLLLLRRRRRTPSRPPPSGCRGAARQR
ncbi:hypothetical protein DBR06_SOUSAS32110002 [Sousa chinensis]|nr:hypothetical protein DBR06_SOUSAS32110002 [Sousa chinensis]